MLKDIFGNQDHYKNKLVKLNWGFSFGLFEECCVMLLL